MTGRQNESMNLFLLQLFIETNRSNEPIQRKFFALCFSTSSDADWSSSSSMDMDITPLTRFCQDKFILYYIILKYEQTNK